MEVGGERGCVPRARGCVLLERRAVACTCKKVGTAVVYFMPGGELLLMLGRDGRSDVVVKLQ